MARQKSININIDDASLQQQTVTKPPSPPLLNGSVDLKSQMLQARRLSQEQHNQKNDSPPMQASIIGVGEGQQQQQMLPPMPSQLTTQQAGSILSRMVTAQNSVNGASVSVQPFRAVASMQDIRRSRNSLNTVPEILGSGIIPQQQRGGGMNQTFNLNNNRMGSQQQQIRMSSGMMQQMGGVANSGGQQQMNPLLKMMEERMAANKASGNSTTNIQQQEAQTRATPAPAPMSGQEKEALEASISKWGGMAQQASTGSSQAKMTMQSTTSAAADKGESSVQEHQHQLQRQTPPGGRVPLSPKQIDLLRELTSSQQNLLRNNVQQQATQNQLLQQQLLQQQQQQLLQQQQQVRGLTRNAVSLAEVDRLRRANQTIQLRQQLVMQERMNEQYNNSVGQYLQQRNIAASALAAGQAAMSQEDLNKFQADAMNKIKKKLSSGDLNSSSFRKRRSWDTHSHDDLASLSSRSPSLTSSTSSNKIHRSNSRTPVTGSMENLRIRSMTNFLVNSPSMRNQSFSNFSSGGSIQQLNNRLSASGFSMKNQSFSSASNLSQQQLVRGPTAGQSASSLASLQQQQQQQHPSTTLRRNNSSNNWIKSLCDQQTNNSSAGKAAAATTQEIQALKKMSSSNSINQVQAAITQQIVANTHQEGLVLNKPIQVQAEESLPPSTERSTPNNNTSETIIMSDLPDRIKYQNAKTDVVKPLDVVKDALSSSGSKCETKSSMDMDDSFFVKVTDMYGGDVVNAIRSNDVDALRKLHADGTKLQCGNRFGETLIHLACRRSSRELVSFLVKEADVSLYVRDDFGRTPMHDCCWRAEPDLELFDMLLDEAPELLMLSDKRGHTPLDYSRREHWALLVPFLKERVHKFKSV